MNIIQTLATRIGTSIATTLAPSLKTPIQDAKKKPLPWVAKSVSKTRKDMESWKRAETMYYNADSPSNYLQQLLYDDVMEDALLGSQTNNRFQQSLSMPFILKNAKGEVDEEQTDILKKHHLYRFLSQKGLESKTYGNSVIQFIFDAKKQLTAELIPRTNIVQQTGTFFADATDQSKGIKYRELAEFGTWVIEYNTGEIGLLNKCIPNVIMLRYALSCWSELCEIYGIPPRVMKTNTTDPKELERAEQMMKDMGSAAWFIIDTTEEFEFADNVNTKGEVFENLIKVAGDRICLAISGTVIGQDTKFGSKGKEDTAQDMLWYIVQDDMQWQEQLWNNINLPALAKHGIIKDGLTFEFEPAEDITQLWNFVKDSLPYFDFDPAWMKNKFGIEVKEKATQQTDPNATKKNALSFFLNASEQEANQNQCCGQAHTLIKLSGSLNDEQLLERFFQDKGERKFDEELFSFTTQNLTEAFSKGYRKKKKAKLIGQIGITYGLDDPAALTAYEMNLFRFGGIKTLAESQLLNKAFRSSNSFNDFKIRAGLITKMHNVDWLRTEYNTAIAVGETSATYQRLITQTELYPYWEYKTVDDNKVRPEHNLLDGLILPSTHELWQKIYPPNGWNCRCYIVPRLKNELNGQNIEENIKTFEAFIASEEFQKATKSGWGINRAETEQVFSANQQYITKQSEADRLLSNLSPSDFKIKEVIPKSKITENEGTTEEAWKYFQDKNINFHDYNNRQINIPEKEFIQAVKDSKLINEIEFILEKPDEVWHKAETKGGIFNQFLYVKYYKDSEPLAFVAELKDGNLIIKALFKLADLAERWGLLIKN